MKIQSRSLAYAIIRVYLDMNDPEPGAYDDYGSHCPWGGKIVVKKIVFDLDYAVTEVARLNILNRDKDCVYFWQETNVENECAGVLNFPVDVETAGRSKRAYEPGYSVIRVETEIPDPEPANDSDYGPQSPWNDKIRVETILLDLENAENEVERLSNLKGDKDCVYFWQYTRIEKIAPVLPADEGGAGWKQ